MKSKFGDAYTMFVGNYYQWSGSLDTMQKYYYAGSQRVAVRVGSGSTSTMKRHYTLGGQRVAVRSGTTLSWLFSDHLGSTSITADNNGSISGEKRYYPWGQERYTSGSTPTQYRFTGQYLESSFNLYWYRSRWYDQSLGRFIQPDTLVPNPGDPVAFDRYHYSRNSPLVFTDPSGHLACDDPHVAPGDCAPRFVSPLDDMVVSKGGDYEGCTDGVCYHVGTDYSVQSGSKLYASSNGSVIIADPCSAENCVYEGNSSSPDVNRGYGSVLVIEYQYHDIPNVIQAELGLKPGDSAYFVYGHLQEINVDTGEHVRRDQVIGLTGDTGNSTAPHLHLEIRTGPSGYIPPGDMCGANNCFNKFDQDARYSYLLDLHRHNPADIHKLYFGE